MNTKFKKSTSRKDCLALAFDGKIYVPGKLGNNKCDLSRRWNLCVEVYEREKCCLLNGYQLRTYRILIK